MTSKAEQLRARYRLRFVQAAQERIDVCLKLMLSQCPENAERVASELRSLGDEATMLGLENLAGLARSGADAARLWRDQNSESAVRVCEHSLHTLSDVVEMLSGMNTGEFTREAERVVAEARDSQSQAADTTLTETSPDRDEEDDETTRMQARRAR